MRVVQRGPVQVGSLYVCIAQVRLSQIGPAKIGVDEASSSQIRSIEAASYSW